MHCKAETRTRRYDPRQPTYARRVTHEKERVSRRIAAITGSATLKIDAQAKALQARGNPVISYAAGEPNFPTPRHIVEAAVEAARDPKTHRYSPTAGLPELRDAIAAKTRRDSGLDISDNQVVVTNGGKQAIYETFATLIDPGDEVLVPSPHWTTYPEAIALAGGIQVEVFAGADRDYRVSVEQLDAALTERTKVLVFVSPSNPTGSVYSPEETKEIGEWADSHGLWIISDEIYQNLSYEGVDVQSIVRAVPRLADRTVLVNGVAKTYAMTGWRVGWLVAPADIAAAATNLQSHVTSNVNNVAQRAAIAALTGPQDAVEAMRLAFDRRRRAIVAGLNAIDGVNAPTPHGAFYVYPDVTGLLNRSWSGVTPATSLELAELILNRIGVAVVPGEAFGRNGFLRFSYALSDDDLLDGVQRLQTFFSRAS